MVMLTATGDRRFAASPLRLRGRQGQLLLRGLRLRGGVAVPELLPAGGRRSTRGSVGRCAVGVSGVSGCWGCGICLLGSWIALFLFGGYWLGESVFCRGL